MEEKEFKITEEGLKPIENNNLKEALNKITGSNNGIREIEKPRELPKTGSYYPEENKKEIPREIKKEKIEEFREQIKDNPITRNHKLISKANLIGIWVLVGIVLLLLIINMFWTRISFDKKDFSPTVNNDITVEPANTTNQNFNTYEMSNNHTILVQPNITIINVINGSGV